MIGWSGLAVGRRCEPVGSWSILALAILAPFGSGVCRGQAAMAGEEMHLERKVWTSLGLEGGRARTWALAERGRGKDLVAN